MQNREQTKFLIRELLSIFDLLEEEDFDKELFRLLDDLEQKLSEAFWL